jgi:hypothetical protein
MRDRSIEPERGRPADVPNLPPEPPPPIPEGGAPPGPPPSGDAWAMGATEARQSSRGRRGRRALIVLAVAVGAVVLLGGIGMAAAMFVLRGSPERLSTRTPADADFFATAYLDPSAAQKINLERMVSRFPALGSGGQLRDLVDGALDDGALSSTGLTTEDIRPWLGSQVAVAGRIEDAGVSFAVLVDSSDDARAESTLARLRARPRLASEDVTWSSIGRAGTTIWIGHPQFGGTPIVLAVDDGTAVLGNSVTFASDVVDTIAGAGALEDSPSFRRATASLPDDVLGLAYVNAGSVIDRMRGVLPGADGPSAVTPGGVGSIVDPSSIEGFAFSLSAEPSGLELDLASTVDPTKLSEQQREALTAAGEHGPNDALTWVPANAYGMAATDVFGEEAEDALVSSGVTSDPTLRGLMGADGVLAHLTGDAALEVSPGGGAYPTGAFVAGTDDESGMRAFLDGLAKRVSRSLAPTPLDALNASGTGEVDPSNARALKRLLHQAAHPAVPSWSSSTYKGVTISTLDLPATGTAPYFGIRPSYAVADGVGILAASPEAIRAMIDAHIDGGADSIATSPAYHSALATLGGLDDQVLYVDVDRVVVAVREALPPEERASFDREVAPNLEPIDAFVGGSRPTASGSTSRVLLLIR